MNFNLPELGEGVYEAEVVRWLVQPGDTVKSGQGLLEVLTDKATMEVPAPSALTIQKLLVEPGAKLKVGDPFLSYEDKKGTAGKPTAEPKEKTAKARNNGAAERVEVAAEPPKKTEPAKAAPRKAESPAIAVKAAPSVRLMARKLGVDLAQVHGSGPNGRILIDDLSHEVKPSPKASAAPLADYGKPGTLVKFAGLRRKIAEHMVESQQTIPHYTYVDECDVTDLVRMRESLKETFAAKGAKITYLAFFVKAAVEALKEIPIVNASLDADKGEIILHDHYHIGIAVATPGGLIVPVVRDADQKSLLEIARDIDRLSSDARAGKAKLEDLRGATFTITSVGNLGGLISTPIVPVPQVAILGIAKIVKRPIYDEHGQIKPADLMYLSLSFDHRVLDGAVGAVFTNAIIKRLHHPATLLF